MTHEKQPNFWRIEGVVEGYVFKTRIELSVYKVHKPRQSGISGSENEGADSVVISGGYEDDEDLGNVIIHTGQVDRSNDSKSQVADHTACLNHHIMFDLGVVAINDDFFILGLDNVSLMVHPDHKIGKEFIEYHREYLYKSNRMRNVCCAENLHC